MDALHLSTLHFTFSEGIVIRTIINNKMTASLLDNQTTNGIVSPIKIALVGVTMIQQSLLEFYFSTVEGMQKYRVVLGKDADAYIVNFDEAGSLEAWNNLYGQEDKPTLVFSNRHEIIDNYIYISRPVTPKTLSDAAVSIQHLLDKAAVKNSKNKASISNDFLQFTVDSSTLSLDKQTLDFATKENKPNSEFSAIKEETKEELMDDFSLIDEINLEQKPDSQAVTEELLMEAKANNFAPIEEPIADKVIQQDSHESIEKEEINKTPEFDEFLSLQGETAKKNQTVPVDEEQNSSHIDDDIFSGLELLDEITLEDNASKEKQEEEGRSATKDELSALDDNISSPDELQHFLDELDELNQKNSKQEEKKKDAQSKKKKGKQQLRWSQLCGKHKNDDYENDSDLKTRFKREETLLPYIVDTISFTERANCWMELAYKPLSIIINPESKLIYSNFSLKDPLFVQICSGKTVEELIEFLEIAPEKVDEIKNDPSTGKLFTYEMKAFLWTVSLLVSHGRLPEDVNPDTRISITNWLGLNEVEKFPYIMQIAAVFNQHHASLNEAASWMTLPKRYVYAFYNGVAALNMIDKNADESNKKKLISTGNDEGTIKNLLFKKII